jgi:hypothetical protein
MNFLIQEDEPVIAQKDTEDYTLWPKGSVYWQLANTSSMLQNSQ